MDPSASRIPNLNTLRSARGGGLGRGGLRNLRGGRHGQHEEPSAADKDKIVQETDQDASVSRMSAISLGYLDDPFTAALVPVDSPRRYPIINRGTYVRTSAIDTLVDQFLAVRPTEQKQIISLGAGSDTRYFRLMSKNPGLPLIYHELDFETNTTQKISAITKTASILELIKSTHASPSDLTITSDSSALYSPTYNIHPVDLRSLIPSADSTPPPLPNFSPTTPTLLLSECCLIYLPPTAADALLTHLSTTLIPSPTPLSCIIYEPIRPSDAFGRVMISNLLARGIILQTLQKYSSLTRQKLRLKQFGFSSGQEAADVDFLWEEWVDEAEKERVGRLEMLDELEEWRMLARHYCVVWGWRDGETGLFTEAWGDLKAQGNDEE